MILDLDVGNTRCKWRLRSDSESSLGSGHCLLDQLWTFEFAGLSGKGVRRIRVASVRGEAINDRIRGWGQESFAVAAEFAVSESVRGRVVNAYADPWTLGVDRWLGLLAADQETQGGACVISCGSAVTVDVIDGEGRHIGGYIAPGVNLMRKSLLIGTDKVLFDPSLDSSGLDLGRSTSDAVYAGTWIAMLGMVERAIGVCRESCPTAELVFTGGDGARVRELLEVPSLLREELVLDGLPIALP